MSRSLFNSITGEESASPRNRFRPLPPPPPCSQINPVPKKFADLLVINARSHFPPTTQFLLFSCTNFTLKLQEMAISGFENFLESIAVLRAGLINFPQPRPPLNLFNVIKISIKVVKNNSPLPSRDLGQIMLNRDGGSYLPQEYLHLVDK